MKTAIFNRKGLAALVANLPWYRRSLDAGKLLRREIFHSPGWNYQLVPVLASKRASRRRAGD